MKKWNQKGEGPLMPVLILIILAGLGYAGYVYLWPMLAGTDNPAPQTAATGTPTDATPTPGTAKTGGLAGSPAAQQVQGAAAMGELYGSGR